MFIFLYIFMNTGPIKIQNVKLENELHASVCINVSRKDLLVLALTVLDNDNFIRIF